MNQTPDQSPDTPDTPSPPAACPASPETEVSASLHARHSGQPDSGGVEGEQEQEGGGGSQVSRDETGGQGSRQEGDSDIEPVDLMDKWLSVGAKERPREVNEGLYLAMRREGWSISESCRRVGLSTSSVNNWRTRRPEFREREAQAESEGDMAMLDLLKGMALSAEDERNRIRAAEVWLRARLPRIERVELSGPGGGPIVGIGVEQEAVQKAALSWAARLVPQDPHTSTRMLSEAEEDEE